MPARESYFRKLSKWSCVVLKGRPMNTNAFMKTAGACAVAVALGLLEAAWTTPNAPGATRPMLGSFGIAVALAVVCWPRLWWVPALGMLEELVQIFAGQLPPVRPNVYQALFHHWSAGVSGINLYPYLSFPLAAILGETIFLYYRQRSSRRESSRDGACISGPAKTRTSTNQRRMDFRKTFQCYGMPGLPPPLAHSRNSVVVRT